jgi:hypothetical protein
MIINIESTGKEISFRDLIEGEYFIWKGLVYIKAHHIPGNRYDAVCLNDGSTGTFDVAADIKVTPVTGYLKIVK